MCGSCLVRLNAKAEFWIPLGPGGGHRGLGAWGAFWGLMGAPTGRQAWLAAHILALQYVGWTKGRPAP